MVQDTVACADERVGSVWLAIYGTLRGEGMRVVSILYHYSTSIATVCLSICSYAVPPIIIQKNKN